jgi:hypothetical protein
LWHWKASAGRSRGSSAAVHDALHTLHGIAAALGAARMLHPNLTASAI